MEAQRFDQWTRSLHSVSSRRTVSKHLAGIMIGVLLVHTGRSEVAARCAAPGKKCRGKKRKTKCCGGARCQGKRCRCPGGREACGKKCCPSGQSCAGTVCVTGQGTCAPGADTCAVGPIFCNGTQYCACYQRIQGGTRCGQPTLASDLDQCASDADCLGLGFPLGTSCIHDEGEEFCGGPDPDRGFCVVPCGSGGAGSSAAALGEIRQP